MNAVTHAFVSSLHVSKHERVTCPECSPERKKSNQKDLDILTKVDGWAYYCHHCNISGFVPFKSFQTKPIYRSESNVIPLVKEPVITKLQTQHYDFLKTRGISERIADEMKLFPAEKIITATTLVLLK